MVLEREGYNGRKEREENMRFLRENLKRASALFSLPRVGGLEETLGKFGWRPHLIFIGLKKFQRSSYVLA